jgi:hypothetical protein
MKRTDACASEIDAQGFCVLPGQYQADQVTQLRAAILAQYDALGRPPLYSKHPRVVSEDVELSRTGLVWTKLLKRRPDLHHAMLDEEVVRIAQAALGPGTRLELTGAVLADHTRPFFSWHDHAGGIDQELYRRRGEHPQLPKLQRLAMIVYLDEMKEGAGRLLVHPKRNADGSAPCTEGLDVPWPGQVAVEGPPGTTVLVDQTTWHAALPRTMDENLRVFFGLWFAAADAGETELSDESLHDVKDPSPLWKELVPGATN